jgi:epoxyqueuosine reductase
MEQLVREEIRRFVVENPANRYGDDGGPYFMPPLVGVAAWDDPLFDQYKQIIGSFHLTPAELFGGAYDTAPATGSVIVYILPITEPIRVSNRPQKEFPSRAWSHTRTHGETLNGALRRHLVDWLSAQGQRALAPQFSPLWREIPDSPVRVASTWSERHAAYAAGLGTFSLNDGLITAQGIAHRVGSVVTDLVLPPTPRTAPDYRWNCLYHRDGSCGACIARCPVGALSKEGHDKTICREHVYGTIPRAVSAEYGVPNTGCGLCQTRVPCESRIP